MKFFVYTVNPGARPSPVYTPSVVNAQPMREILSMMTIANGEIHLHLPGKYPEPVLVRDHVVARSLDEALALTALEPHEFARYAKYQSSDREALSEALRRIIPSQKADQ